MMGFDKKGFRKLLYYEIKKWDFDEDCCIFVLLSQDNGTSLRFWNHTFT